MLATKGVQVVVNTVMHRLNIGDLFRMYEILRNLGVRSWRIGYPKETGFFKDGTEKFGLSWDVMANASFSLLRHHFAQGRPFHLQMEYLYREELFKNFNSLTDNDFVCDYENKRESCCIKPNGDVVSCAYCTDFPVGNIRKDALSAIWYSSNMQEIKEVRIGDVAECKECELRAYCASGCRINAYFLRGDFRNSRDDYACQAVKFFVEKVKLFLQEQSVLP